MNGIPRSQFLKYMLAAALFPYGMAAWGNSYDRLRGDRVGWARLKTNSPIWQRHADSDPKLMQFFREHTTLAIDPTWYAADAERFAELQQYPFLFSQDIDPIQSELGKRNIAEFIWRGGFLLIDACINPGTRGNPKDFLARQTRQFQNILPGAKIATLPDSHDIFNCFFHFPGGPPHTEDFQGWGDHGLYGVQMGSRLVGVISTSGLQCGWANMKQVAGHDVACMKMLANIYILAMAQGA